MEEIFIWEGRVDSIEDKSAFRWHQCIQENPSHDGLSIIGFSSHAGVARNKGRVGAKDGPKAIRKALTSLPSNSDLQRKIYDAGNIICTGDELEQAQDDCAMALADLLEKSARVINLGGGHEVAWASFLGAAKYLNNTDQKQKRLGIINFDAHFDLRPFDKGASSGSPFLQAANYCDENNLEFHYCCMGVSELGNTQALFNTADKLKVNYCYDHQMTTSRLSELKSQLQAFMDSVDYLYLTIDLDVFPAYVSPGVSATSARGVSVEVIETLIDDIVQSKKLLLADIAECNPTYDIDNRTAKLAARLVYLLSK